MQQLFIDPKTTFHPLSLLYASIATTLCLVIWFLPYTHDYCTYVDRQFFLSLNKTLAWSINWQQICGWLNHPDETWLNLVVMVGINLLAIAFLKKDERIRALIFILYCWLFFQLGLVVSHAVFGNLLNIERASPSIVIRPYIKLSALINHPVKDYSANSFPAGHTFVLVYWALFTAQYATRKFVWLACLIAVLLIFPRLISGAHWLSDVIFTTAISYIWFALATDTPLYNYVRLLVRPR